MPPSDRPELGSEVDDVFRVWKVAVCAEAREMDLQVFYPPELASKLVAQISFEIQDLRITSEEIRACAGRLADAIVPLHWTWNGVGLANALCRRRQNMKPLALRGEKIQKRRPC